MIQVDPWFLFALGALCMLTCVLVIGLAVGLRVLAWAWRRVSVFDSLGASRNDGKVAVSGTLVDLARPSKAPRARGAKDPGVFAMPERRPS